MSVHPVKLRVFLSEHAIARLFGARDFLRTLTLRGGLSMLVGLAVLSLVGLGGVALWELHKQHEHLTRFIESLAGETANQNLALIAAMTGDLAQTRTEIIVAVILMSLLLIGLSLLVARRFTQPLKAVVAAAESLGRGDLTARVDERGAGEMGILAHALNEAATRMGKNTKRINDTTISLNAMSNEIYKAVSTQSLGANRQAASVEQIGATVDRIREIAEHTRAETEELRDNADRVMEAGTRGRTAADSARRSMEQILQRMEAIARTIGELEASSQQIGAITTTVKTMAQQSKMLALNAAIEAAKAGEAGAGFAVVATEMRQLAEQSEASTAQVKDILEKISAAAANAVDTTRESANQVEQGNQAVALLGQVVEDQLSVIGETLRTSRNIATSVDEEAAHLEEAAQAMTDIRAVVAEFVASTRRNEQSAGEVSLLASRIRDTVAKYTLS